MASNVSGEWDSGVSITPNSYNGSIVVDSTNNIHAVANHYPSSDFNNICQLVHADNSTGSFIPELIMESSASLFELFGDRYANGFAYPDLAIDNNGKDHVVTVIERGKNNCGDIVYLTNSSGSWKDFILDRSTSCTKPSIAVDNDGFVHISYSEYIMGTGVVKYLKFDPSQLSDAVPTDPVIGGFCYGPYRGGQSPILGVYPSLEQIDEDLNILSLDSRIVRTYGTEGTLFDIARLCESHGLRCVQGVWLSGDPLTDQENINTIKEIDSYNPKSVNIVVVGNESVYSNRLSKDNLIVYINQLTDETNFPMVTTAEPWHVWRDNPDLADAVNCLFVHVHPYWEGIPVENAADYVVQRWQELKTQYPNKQVVIAETGWPSDGPSFGSAVPSLENQERFFRDFLALAGSNSIPWLAFEAFDEPHKVEKDSVGPHWGLYYVDRAPKPSFVNLLN